MKKIGLKPAIAVLILTILLSTTLSRKETGDMRTDVYEYINTVDSLLLSYKYSIYINTYVVRSKLCFMYIK